MKSRVNSLESQQSPSECLLLTNFELLIDGAIGVEDERDRSFQSALDRNLRTSPHNIARWAYSSNPRLPEQPIPPPIRLRQSQHDNRSRDRPPHRRWRSRIRRLQETWSPEDPRTPCPSIRENRLLRRKKIQAHNRLLDSSFCCKFSAVSAALPNHHF